MEKNIVITLTVREAKNLESDCKGFDQVLNLFVEKLSELNLDSSERAMMKLAIKSHQERLERMRGLFSTDL